MKKIFLLLGHFFITLSIPSLFAKKIAILDQQKTQITFSIIKFKIGSKVEGSFRSFYGHSEVDRKEKLVHSLNLQIFVPSINTGIEKRDHHLLNDDFFDAKNFPVITFTSTTPAKIDDRFVLKGLLKIKETSKELELNCRTLSLTDDTITFEADAVINRLDYGITWNQAMEKSDWKKVLGILGKTVLDESVNIKIQVTAKIL